MKIGINALGFNAEEHLDKVLAPWLELRKEGQKQTAELDGIESLKKKQPESTAAALDDDKLEIFISAAYGVFPEVDQVAKNARPEAIVPVDNTLDKLREYNQKSLIDFLFVAQEPMYEKDLRNATLPYLLNGADVDFVWLLDLQDEVYTKEQILNIIKYLKANLNYSCFRINFKNYFGSESMWYKGFNPFRIWSTKNPAPMYGFIGDNEVGYRNGAIQHEIKTIEVPEETALVEHHSWDYQENPKSRQRVINKISFQLRHYGHSSFRWDHAKQKLEIDDLYYKNTGKTPPILEKD